MSDILDFVYNNGEYVLKEPRYNVLIPNRSLIRSQNFDFYDKNGGLPSVILPKQPLYYRRSLNYYNGGFFDINRSKEWKTASNFMLSLLSGGTMAVFLFAQLGSTVQSLAVFHGDELRNLTDINDFVRLVNLLNINSVFVEFFGKTLNAISNFWLAWNSRFSNLFTWFDNLTK